MTTTRLGLVAIAALAITYLIDGVHTLSWAIAFKAWGQAMVAVAIVAISVILFRWRTGIAQWMFGREDDGFEPPRACDAQIVSLGLIGVWQLIQGLISLATNLASDTFPSRTVYVQSAVLLLAGAFLAWKPGIIAQFWIGDSRSTRGENA